MTKSLLLDTSAIIPHFRRNESVTTLLTAADHLYLPSIVLGELFHGAFRLPFPEKQLERIRTFMSAVVVVSVGSATAEHFGRITAQLTTAGRTIPSNDAWIAALACEYQFPLVADDEHFTWVPGLNVIHW